MTVCKYIYIYTAALYYSVTEIAVSYAYWIVHHLDI